MKEKAKENKEIIKEILKECNWKEKIIVKMLENFIIKIYHNIRLKTMNAFLEE